MTSQDDRTLLLRLARNAIVAHLGGVPEPIPEAADVFIRQGGAFVTIHSRGELRGCIGQLEPGDSLGIVIPRCAVSASSADPDRRMEMNVGRLPQKLLPARIRRSDRDWTR